MQQAIVVKPTAATIEYGFTKDRAHEQLQSVEEVLEAAIVIIRDVQDDLRNINRDLTLNRYPKVDAQLKSLKKIVKHIAKTDLQVAIDRVNRLMEIRREYINGDGNV